MEFEKIVCAGCGKEPQVRVTIQDYGHSSGIRWSTVWPEGWTFSTIGWCCPDCEVRIVPKEGAN